MPKVTVRRRRVGHRPARPPARPLWQVLLTALLGFAFPFVLVLWFGVGSNAVAEEDWHRQWEELHGVALGPVEEGVDWDRLPVRYERRDGRAVEEPVVIADLHPWQGDNAIRSARAGDRVPLIRDRDRGDQLLVSTHFRPQPLLPYVFAGTVLGGLNGGVLALVYRRRHRM